MDWTLCFVCTLISMASVRCQNIPKTYHLYDHTDNIEPDDIATQRMSERSLPLDSTRQRLQEVQRRLHRDDQDLGDDSQFNPTRRSLAPQPSMSPDVVVFPGPVRRQSTQFVPKVPEECLKTGICEDLPDYPEDHVAAVIEELGNATEKFQVDELDTPEIVQRLGPPEDTELCEFSVRVLIPQAAPDKEGKWYYIVNRKDKPVQGFHVEICNENRSPCSNLAYFYSGYEASCRQKFMLRFMAALDANGKLVKKNFKLPSCCSCVVKQSD